MNASPRSNSRRRQGGRVRQRRILGGVLAAVLAVGLGRSVPSANAIGQTIDVDRTDDTAAASACTAAANDCSLRGALAYADSHPNTTVHVPAGTYVLSNGEIAFGSAGNTSTTIVGDGAATTIISGNSVTRIFDINPNVDPGVAAAISAVTLQRGVADTFGGGAIVAGGPTNTLTLTDVTFAANTAPSPFSGAGLSFGGGGTLTVTNSRFTNNTAADGVGGAIFMNMSNNAGNLTVTGSRFSGNTSVDEGGAVWAGGTASNVFTITGSTFTGNAASGLGRGGAVHIASGSLVMHYNRITGNTGTAASGIYGVTGSSVNASSNWWGCNAGPGSSGCDTVSAAGAALTPRLVLSISANPSTVPVGLTSTVTASFLADSANAAVAPSNLGAMVGTAVSFGSTLGVLSGQQATIQATGTATATYTASNAPGNGSANATVDNQNVSAALTIPSPIPTITMTTPTDASTVTKPVTISGTATDDIGVVTVEVSVYRYVNGGQWWNGTAWQSAYARAQATLGTPNGTSTTWTYSFNPAETGGRYWAQAVAVDATLPDNLYMFTPVRFFQVADNADPAATITAPAAGAFSAKPVVISGTATDNSAVAGVEVAIYGAGKWWNGTAWQSPYVRVPVTVASPGATSTTWQYSFTPPETAGVYAVNALVYDSSYRYVFTPYTYFGIPDTVAPTGSVTTPANNATISAPVSITGTSADDIGVASVRLAITDQLGNTWNGTTWQAGFTTFVPTVSGASGDLTRTWSYSFNPPPSNVSYALTALIIDTSGNYLYTPYRYFTIGTPV